MKFPCDYIVHCEPIEKGTKVTMSDWEELIRCRDCKYSKPIDSEWLECQHDKRVMKPRGFCSWADPKE